MRSNTMPLIVSQRQSIHTLSTLAALATAFASYWLAAIHHGEGNLSPSLLGVLTVLQFSFMAMFMVLAWWSAPKSSSIRDYQYLLWAGVIARLILISIDSYTSNDMARYLFDGKIALSGLDPYRINHDAPELEQLRNLWAPPPEHSRYVTLYPPMALGLFSLAASAGVEWAQWVWKVFVTLAGIATLGLGTIVLHKADKLKHLPLIALSPLLILETGIGMHVDSFSTLAVLAAVLAWQSNRLKLCGLFIGFGTLIKLLPIVLLLPIFFSLIGFRQKTKLVISAIATVIAGYLVAFSIGLHPIGSIGVFFQKWRFGSPIFNALEATFSTEVLIFLLPALAIFGLIIVAILAWCASSWNQSKLTVYSMQLALAVPLLLSPVVFPWYLSPLVPLVALAPNPFMLMWICLLPLTYEVLGQFTCCGIWEPSNWPLVVVFVAMLFTAMLGAYTCKPLQNLKTVLARRSSISNSYT